MADNIPAKFKAFKIAPFAKLAAQYDHLELKDPEHGDPEHEDPEHEDPKLERRGRIIAFWLRFYIAEKILPSNLHETDAECGEYATNLMEKLEQTRKMYPDEDALKRYNAAAPKFCKRFALHIFEKANKEMATGHASEDTADTFQRAANLLDMLAIWEEDPEPDIKSKRKAAKYHAIRILKALRAGEDPNLTNPVHEPSSPQAASPFALDPNDPEVLNIIQGIEKPPMQNPYQSYVESAPNTDAQPSPTFSAPKVSPPPNLPSAPTGYGSHRDVSPMSHPAASRQGSVDSAGGGYFPRANVPTFTADNAAPGLPTAPSLEDEPMTTPFETSSLPTGSEMPQAPQVPDPQNFYQNATLPPQNMFQQAPPRSGFASPPPPTFRAPSQPQYNHSPQPPQPPQPAPMTTQVFHQDPIRTDEESVLEAQKHAKWAISALNFEDVNTAVKELRVALRALGAN